MIFVVFFIDVMYVECILLVIFLLIVFIIELFNIVIEKFCDYVSIDIYLLIGCVKDIGLVVVFISLMMVGFMWISIFW